MCVSHNEKRTTITGDECGMQYSTLQCVDHECETSRIIVIVIIVVEYFSSAHDGYFRALLRLLRYRAEKVFHLILAYLSAQLPRLRRVYEVRLHLLRALGLDEPDIRQLLTGFWRHDLVEDHSTLVLFCSVVDTTVMFRWGWRWNSKLMRLRSGLQICCVAR